MSKHTIIAASAFGLSGSWAHAETGMLPGSVSDDSMRELSAQAVAQSQPGVDVMRTTSGADTAPLDSTIARTPSTSSVDATTSNVPPLAGANSFTEVQARDRIMKAGFTAIVGLKLDDKGIWRGFGGKNGKSVAVALDFKGNVVEIK